jgi:hypothetical protein
LVLIARLALMLAAAAASAATPDPSSSARAGAADVQQAEPAVQAAPPAAAKPARRTKPVAASPERPSGAAAMDRIDLDPTQITGNRELPKVMVIVPWKRSDIGDLAGRPANSLIDEALQPVDREVFRREVAYYDALSPDRPRSETSVTAPTAVAEPEK